MSDPIDPTSRDKHTLPLLNCPTCGASLSMPESATLKCQYCGSVVLVPKEFRSKLPADNAVLSQSFNLGVSRQVDEPDSRQSKSVFKAVVFITILIMAIGLGITVLAGAGMFFTTTRVVTMMEESIPNPPAFTSEAYAPLIYTVQPTEMPTATQIPFLENVLQFGGIGSGPGLFQDPREITVDRDGNIYIADYNTGRVQKFDASGTFEQMFQTGAGRNQTSVITDLASGYDGSLYVVRVGDILIYKAGESQPEIVWSGEFPQTFYQAIALDPTNTVYSLALSNSGYDLVKLGLNGEVTRRVKDIVYGVNQNTSVEKQAFAVDGLGNSYFISIFEPQVYKYDKDGNFIDRLGTSGKDTGQLSRPQKLILDSLGRMYILDTSGVKIFDQAGEFLNYMEWDFSLGSPRDMALDMEGNIYFVSSKGLVTKYKLNW